MDEQMCPRCKTTKYRNPGLKLMVNVCGHALCENCVEALFVRGSGACIQCGIALRRTNFRMQIFEDESVEKEVDIRKKILRDFNKMEEDFASLREYNNYLEEVETIIFNLANGIDVEETKHKIEDYKKANAQQIKKNKIKLSKDAQIIEELLEEEKAKNETWKKHILEETQKEKNERKMKKEALIDDLMHSDLPASRILTTHKDSDDVKLPLTLNIKTESSSSVSYSVKGASFARIPKQEGEPYCHTPVVMETYGPAVPDVDDLDKLGYLNHIRASTDSEIGGGFLIKVAVSRAIQEAMCGIFYGFDTEGTSSPAFSSSSSSDNKQDVEMS